MNHEFYYENINAYGTEKLRKLYVNQNRPLTRVETRLVTQLVATKEAYDHIYADTLGYSMECTAAFHDYNEVCKALIKVCKAINRVAKVITEVEMEVFGQ